MDIQAFGTRLIKDKSGKVIGEEHFIEHLAEYVKPYTLVPRNADLSPLQPEQIAIAAAGVSADVTLAMVDEGLFEGAYFTAQYEDAAGSPIVSPLMLVELIDNQRHVSLTGRPCQVQNVIGTGQRPFVLPESLPIDKQQPIICRFTDYSGAISKIRFQIHGQRLYSEQVDDPRLDAYIRRRQERNRRMSMYLCPLDTDPTIVGGATQDVYYTNDSNIYFEVRKITYISTGAFKFRIIDEKANEMQSGWIYSTAALGTGQYPFIYYGPWMIKPGGKVTFRIMDMSGQSNLLKLTLCGRQHFVYPGP